jgi:ABC-type multidrug transport system fused ATPase/permease subunit
MNGTRGVLAWIYKYTKKQLLWVAALALISGAVALGFILLAIVSKNILDIATGDSEGSIVLNALGIIGIIALQGAFNVLYSNIIIRAAGKIDIKIKQGLFEKLLNKRYTEVTRFHSGEILNRFTSDVDIVVDGVIGIIPEAISLATKLIAGLVVLLVIDVKFTLIVCAVGAVVFVASKIYSKHFKYLHKLVQSADGVMRSFIQECIENLVVIKSFANNEVSSRKLYERQKEALRLKIKRNTVSNIASTGVYVLFTASYYAALVWGAMQISLGAISFGTLTAFLQIIDQIKAPMKNISGLIPQFYSMIASAERLMELEQLEEEKIEPHSETAAEIYQKMQALCVQKLTFAYKNEPVLQNADMTINKGEIVAIAGPSGIGKSTIMRLMLGLILPENGRLCLKTNDGDINIDSGLRKMFAYVPQGNMILSGSIRENIAFCNTEASTDDVMHAAKSAMLWDFISSLPEGMETVIGERGLGLSEGQLQRIAVARALLSDAPILLLDEATSALDEATEKALLENIKKLQNRTCIFISHKQRTIKNCDKIFYIKNKKLTECSVADIAREWEDEN